MINRYIDFYEDENDTKTYTDDVNDFFNMRIFSFYLLFISLLFQGCFETNKNFFDGKNISINSEIKVDSSIINFYLPYKSKLQDGLMSKPISYSLKTYKKNDGILNSSLGNMFEPYLK